MASILAPLVAGIVSAIQESGVQNQIVNFAQRRVTKSIEEHSESIAKHGERCGSVHHATHSQCACYILCDSAGLATGLQ